MTDEDEVAASSHPAVQNVEIVGKHDWFLQSIIDTVTSSGLEISITLTVGGAIISGMLISGRKYFIELRDVILDGSQDDDARIALGDGWKNFSQIYDKPEEAADDWQVPGASYIHLRGAKLFSPGQVPIPGNSGVLWRGKLSAVDSFFIGSLSGE